MKKLVLVAAILAGTTVAASAADMAPRYYSKAPPPMVAPIYNWGGFYVGVNGGWGSSHNCYSNTAVFGVAFTPLGEGCHDATGGTVGGQVGYRWQAGNWVFGLEAQGNWADFSGSNASLVFAGLTNRTRIDAFGLFTGQVGYAWNNALLYVKGGAAVTDSRYDIRTAATNVLIANTGDQTRWGGTIGAGVEYGFAPNWSAGVEYDHIFTQDKNLTFTAPGGAFVQTDRVRQDVDLVTARVNYRWGGPVVPKY
jgi:outer membrane immunogenic protein